ncbi:MAG: thiamine-phosphate kinase [Candidatus Hydrogenedens sp.]
MIRLKDIGELSFIKRVESLIPRTGGKNVVVAIGDDCAVVKIGSSSLLISSDMSVENIHFLTEGFPPFAIGWKAMASAWSDIAGMGGQPRWAVVSLALPESISVQRVESIYRGMLEATKFVNGAIIGGDTTTSSNNSIVIDVTVVGEVERKKFVTRSGAKPGDILAVTGTLGNSSAGLLALLRKLPVPALWRSHWYPIPRVQEGKWLCAKGKVNAMIDISDGLISDAEHIAEMSHVGINICKSDIPVSKELTEFCRTYNLEMDNFTLGGGEEYQLLVTIPKESWEQTCSKFNRKFLCSLTAIGYVTDEWKGVRIDGAEPTIKGYEHFI